MSDLILADIEAFHAALAPKGRILGFDVGTKTLGLALSDPRLMIASPLEILRRTKFTADAAALARVVESHGIAGYVVGLPVNMDGSEGPRAQSARAFARNLVGALPRPLTFWDERLSTAAVTRMMIDADASRARRAELVDKLAAAFILQGALDRLKALGLVSL